MEPEHGDSQTIRFRRVLRRFVGFLYGSDTPRFHWFSGSMWVSGPQGVGLSFEATLLMLETRLVGRTTQAEMTWASVHEDQANVSPLDVWCFAIHEI